MTVDQLVERSLRQLNAGQPQPHTWPDSSIDIAACVMQARQKVARDVMYDSSLRSLLQQEYLVTLDANGEANLLTATGSVTSTTGEILIDGVRMGAVIDADGNKLQPLLHYSDFISPQPTVYAYYCIKDRATILTRAKDVAVNSVLDIQSVNGPLTITASYTPATVDNFPLELEDDLVNALVAIVASKVSLA